MNQKILIRKATHADVEPLIELLHDLFSREADFTFDQTKQRRGLELILNNPHASCIIVADLEGQVIGMASAQLVISTAEGGKSALIEDVVVHKEFRGCGVGTKILTTLEAWSRGQGASRLVLQADQNNHPALKFYKGLDWQLTNLVCFHKKNL